MADTLRKIENFFNQFPRRTYDRGTILIRADEEPSGIFYLTQGTVREYALSKKGEEVVVNIFRPHTYFPMSWGVNQSHNNYFYETLTDAELLKAPREAVIEFVKTQPDILFDLLSRVYTGTDGLLARLTYLMTGSASNRLVAEIIIMAKRFGVLEPASQSVVCTVTEKELASYTGMTRETISREIKNLRKKNLINYLPGKLSIPSLAKLEEELL